MSSERLNLLLLAPAHLLENPGRLWQTPSQIPLSDQGQQYAEAFAQAQKKAPDFILTSSDLASVQSAACLQRRFPLAIVLQAQIEEFRYLPLAQLSGVQRKEAIVAYWTDPDPMALSGEDTENFNELIRRAKDFLGDLAEPYYQGARELIGFGGVGFIRAVRMLVEHLTAHPSQKELMEDFWDETLHAQPILPLGGIQLSYGPKDGESGFGWQFERAIDPPGHNLP